MYTCKICNIERQTKSALFNHIKIHKISKEAYITNYDPSFYQYTSCKICGNQIPIGRTYCSNICKYKDSELNARRRRKELPNKDQSLKCKYCGKIVNDVKNFGGHAKKHLLEHNIDVDSYMEHYDLIDRPVKEKFHCPLDGCNWTTVDLTNQSGWFSTHLRKVHDLSVYEFVDKFPEYKYLWSYYIVDEKRKELFETENGYIECQICHEKFKALTNTHLQLHGTTRRKYKRKYGSTISKTTHDKLSELWHQGLGTCTPDCKSKAEIEIYDFLKENGIENIIMGDRTILNGYELDLYLPDHNIAIEYNGIYWHSFKDKDYHLFKTEECEKQNIHLIQIFEDEWAFKKDIVKEKLKSILKLNTFKIYARQCIIKEINSKEKEQFLKQYHIQGGDKSQIKLGLFYNNELISVMTFGKGRKALGSSAKMNQYELIRFASKYQVVGAGSKLLKYFKNTYNPEKIISYADRRWTFSNSNIYEKIGFKKVSKGSPNYWYVFDTIRLHRFNFTKHVIVEKLHGDPELTEWENMIMMGYKIVWDCGSLKYELIN